MAPIIIVENVSKKYSRKANEHLAYGISDLLAEILSRPSRRDLRKDEFWAVKDVSFHLERGETFGLLGRNGSGKTTVLQMMNGLIKPDAGAILMDGSAQALINLGAGFNTALSGRENIFNAAALHGFNRKQTRSILDQIIDFSGIEEFIDSPVQTYSKGMYARLGFAVAVHLRPDILLVDEILSVGDYAFQNKCNIKMHQLKKEGVTIVLVSHSHTYVAQICEKALWLHKGRMMKLGPAKEVTQAYIDFLDQKELEDLRRAKELKGQDADAARIRQENRKAAKQNIYGVIYDEEDTVGGVEVNFLVNGRQADELRVHDELVVRYQFDLKVDVTDLNVSLVFFRRDGLKLTTISTLNGDLLKHVHRGRVRCEVRIPDLHFTPGLYGLVMPIHEGKSYLWRNVVKEFVVMGNGRLTWQLTDFDYEYEVLKS